MNSSSDQPSAERERFQVDLSGIIDLLSNHLYSGPRVFVRELLQNGVDAIRARSRLEPEHVGRIRIEVVRSGNGPPTLIFEDNGVGLTEEEAHRFLATIGQSSKRGDVERPDDFIGQFGIGLLSCFLVSDEIVLITRSAREEGPAIQWRGRTDGTYSVERVQSDVAPGCQVFLRAREADSEYFQLGRLRGLLSHYGAYLPCEIRLCDGDITHRIERTPPWREYDGMRPAERESLLTYGRETFDTEFLDAIPLKSQQGGIDGVAFVLRESTNVVGKQAHRVYLKNMLLSERTQSLLPEWAFFVRCVINANNLRPTASREAFYEDDRFHAARDELGQCLRGYLVDMAHRDPQRLEQLVGMHHVAIKALSLEDDECLRLFAPWLPVETSLGDTTLGEFLKEQRVLRYAPSLDQFRQISQVAAAQSVPVLNAGYVYDREILERLPEVFPDLQIEPFDAESLTEQFEELTLDERDEVFDFVRLAEVVLQPYHCGVEIRKFRPVELPMLYASHSAYDFLRSVEQTKEVADPLWSGVLDAVSADVGDSQARLCLNYANNLVRRLAAVEDREARRRCIEMLYVQALLLGRHPLNRREMRLLNEGLLGLIHWAIDAHDGKS
ncbi:MAG: HSP90 family protein [Pirellulaceae bacterium]